MSEELRPDQYCRDVMHVKRKTTQNLSHLNNTHTEIKVMTIIEKLKVTKIIVNENKGDNDEVVNGRFLS